jgi:natural product biosynthesis luciferase-like monooxygenase protein
VQREFPIADAESSLGLNAQCYQAGLESFAELVAQIEQGSLTPREQDQSQRTYHGLTDRPPAAATLDWSRPAPELARLIRALDFGRYPNPVMLPKVNLGASLLLAREAQVTALRPGVPGEILELNAASLTVACGEGALVISRLTDEAGADVDVPVALGAQGLRQGSIFPAHLHTGDLAANVLRAARHEGWWREQLSALELSDLPFAQRESAGQLARVLLEPAQLPGSQKELLASFMLLLSRLGDRTDAAVACVAGAALAIDGAGPGYFAPLAVLRAGFVADTPWTDYLREVSGLLDRVEESGPWLADLPAREPDLRPVLAAVANASIRLFRCKALPVDVSHLPVAGAALLLAIDEQGRCAAFIDGRITRAALDRLTECWAALLRSLRATGAACASASILPPADQGQLEKWRMPQRDVQSSNLALIHRQFEAQVARTPTRRACTFEGISISYDELNAAANRLARHLQSLGVKPGDLVGIQVPRSTQMVVALLATLKVGAAYVPLDPTYPAERLAFMAADAGLRVVISRSDVQNAVSVAHVVSLDTDAPVIATLAEANPGTAGDSRDLAYVIYTSGSTGKPKGVMVEHGNVANFFAGIDRRIGADPGVWLAVTSISFDISVLELLWTLTRGFTVVLHGDALRIKGQVAKPVRSLDFGFFYWNVAKSESDYDAEKYRLLLESARFADTHGFNSVWTPERHFEAFGGLFPNPSVTCAALATITRNVQLRAGSCVVPLHSPIRVAEEWAVVDNLSNGRVGMSVASGWAPPDFAIRPEGFANAKQVMFESTEIIKRLWRGETVIFPGPKGEVKVRTLPRPIQKELPIWVTTAGNIDTYIQAGKSGANVLTHLLGQTIEEVADKIVAYRKARAEAGHAGRGIVTVMLHTLVGPDPQLVEEIVRQPMKDYLKSAVFLVKAAAWQFPTFKKMSEDQGKTLDEFFASISEQDMDDLLEFAFLRYFRTSGLFGTPEQCLDMVRRVAEADADEIACLIDFGIKTEIVLEHLPWLDQLRSLAQSAVGDGDHSLAGLLRDEKVTHFQCTPTMATMLASDTDSRPGLARLKHMMIGGEALPPDLARTLADLVTGRVSNMYGPTETTIWSTVGGVDAGAITPANTVSIGEPLLNQSVQVLDAHQQPMPVGIAGEIVIGGKGVSRGYWQRPELTAEKFLGDALQVDARQYRTGDLGRFLPDGRLECLGRLDQQVKIRGFRIELGEIEALLREQDDIAEAAVVLRELAPGDQRLIAYVRTQTGRDADPDSLRAALAAQLPDFMIPPAVVSLKALPLTPNGKIDRKALPLPRRNETTPEAGTAAGGSGPTSDAEGLVMDIWQRALGLNQIGLRDNFFDIGGHSLLVIQVLKELRDKIAKPIQMTDLFRHTTIESLARFIGGDAGAESAALRGRSRAAARRAARAQL